MADRVRILVPLSGGKDSQACLQAACESHERHEIRALFCNTQWEHPKTIAHIAMLRDLYGVRVDEVSAGGVIEQLFKHEQFPVGGARFCTEELKIWPTKRYVAALAREQGSRLAVKSHGITASTEGGFEVWYGMRTDESAERRTRYAGKVCDEVYAPHEVLAKYPQYLAKLGVMFRLAIVNWSTADVMAYLDGRHNPLYDEGFDRVGCFPCLAAGDATKEKAFNHDDVGRGRHYVIKIVAQAIGKSPWTSKGGKSRNESCALMCGD